MITAVSASETNTTDTESTTYNVEISSTSIDEIYENNVTDAISIVDNLDFSSENNIDENNSDDLTNEHFNDENTTFKNTASSNVELEQSYDVVGNSLQNKKGLLGATNNILINSNDDANDLLTSNGDNILCITSNDEILSSSSTTFIIGDINSHYLQIKLEIISQNNYKWTVLDSENDHSWSSLMYMVLDEYDYIIIYNDDLYAGVSSSFSLDTNKPVIFGSYWYGNGEFTNNYMPLPTLEEDTTVSVTNPSVKYNSGSFSVSGTVTTKMI